MTKIFYFSVFILFSTINLVWADTYPEVVFDNSLIKGSYAKSKVAYTGESWVENRNGHLLVSDSIFFTPGNSLSLRYYGAQQGNWEAQIKYARQKYHYKFSDTDVLHFRLLVKTKHTKIQDLPNIFLVNGEGKADTIALTKYITTFQADNWIHVKIPVRQFKSYKAEATVQSVGFSQQSFSDVEHQLYIDQIEFLPQKYADVKNRSAAVLTAAIGYDKMVHLKWQLPLSPSIRYVKIYRADNQDNFLPIAIRPIYMQSCLDVVPALIKSYKYKITWLDNNYEESPASIAREVSTKPMTDDEIVSLVQLTHINYFVENFDVNSGMYMPYRSKDKAVVSTQETGGAILSLLVGVEKKFVTRQIALNRISKIVFFLMKAQQINGVFPAYFDGRKGIPEYKNGTDIYDVVATSSIIESLLIARQYFDKEDEFEKDLRNRITALYNQINWKSLLISENSYPLLRAKFNILTDESNTSKKTALYGVDNVMNTYLLAIGATKNAIDKSSYFDAIYYDYKRPKYEILQEFERDIYADTLTGQLNTDVISTFITVDSTYRSNVLNPVVKFGTQLGFGTDKINMTNLYKSFMTINPASLIDSVNDWKNTLKSYGLYHKRKDNEYALGSNNPNIWGYYENNEIIGNYRVNPSLSISASIWDENVGTRSLLELYKNYGDILLSEYGFKAWLDLKSDDVSDEYLGANNAAVVLGIENAKNGFIWKLYDQIPEIIRAKSMIFTLQNKEAK